MHAAAASGRIPLNTFQDEVVAIKPAAQKRFALRAASHLQILAATASVLCY